MTEMLSPGVYTQENDASAIAPSVSSSIAAFSGEFKLGPIGTYTLNTSVADLIANHGYPKNDNFNDWFQAYNFLQYGNKLLISRAGNVNGSVSEYDSLSFVELGSFADNGALDTFSASDVTGVKEGQMIKFQADIDDLNDDAPTYLITAIDTISDGNVPYITVHKSVDVTLITPGSKTVAQYHQIKNGVIEVSDNTETQFVTFEEDIETNSVERTYEVYDAPSDSDSVYFDGNIVVGSMSEYEMLESSIAFDNASNAKLRITSRNPGAWAGDIEICIATPDSFVSNSANVKDHKTKYAFPGVSVDDIFEYAPTGTQFGVIVKYDNVIQEIWTVDTSANAKDSNNRTTYVEHVINNGSSYIFIKDNTANNNAPGDTTLFLDPDTNTYVGSALSLLQSADSPIQADDIITAYELFDNKEELDIDIIIGNETDSGASAITVATSRGDCLAFIGANFVDCVGVKASEAVTNLVAWRQSGDLNVNTMFGAGFGNYKYQYDRYNDVFRWVNLAGDMAGLRAQTSSNRASWWISAGLERGQIKNVTKLAFNPSQAMMDMLYKSSINPCVTFPGQGPVCWGQKTLLSKASSFDRVNVRGLFNTVERSLSRMAKFQVMEFNDVFTRNRIVSMIKPYLGSVQAGRGIQEFMVICDESNNTPDVISRNQLVVDIYIKPTYAAEFILLRFTNAGTNSFSTITGA